jgi:hypothetical protein
VAVPRWNDTTPVSAAPLDQIKQATAEVVRSRRLVPVINELTE